MRALSSSEHRHVSSEMQRFVSEIQKNMMTQESMVVADRKEASEANVDS